MTRRGFVGPLILLTIGFILLFNNLGIIPWDIWKTLWRFWPVILILIGIEILVCCSGSKITYFLAVLFGVIVIIGTVTLALSGVPQSGYNKNPTAANLNDRDLSGWDMNFANLIGANLSNSKLDGANLNFADLRGADLTNAKLNGANLNFANIEDANLSNANLNGANLNFASLKGTNMSGAQLDGANLFGARTSISTICPDFRQGPCW
ncbi:MAG TPA: pentapeptide repeat-containing protein [Candidatus Methanoperedens sp.]